MGYIPWMIEHKSRQNKKRKCLKIDNLLKENRIEIQDIQSNFLNGQLFWDGQLSSFQHNQHTTTSLTHLNSLKQTKRTVAWYTLHLRLSPILRFKSFKRFINLFKHSNNQFEKYQKYKTKVIKWRTSKFVMKVRYDLWYPVKNFVLSNVEIDVFWGLI